MTQHMVRLGLLALMGAAVAACSGATVDEGASSSGGPGRRDAGFVAPSSGGGNGASSSSGGGGNNASSSSGGGGNSGNASSSGGVVSSRASSVGGGSSGGGNVSSSSGGGGGSSAVVGSSSVGGGGSSGVVGSSSVGGGGSSSSGGTVTTDPFNADNYCTVSAQTSCSRSARCDPQGLAFNFDSEALCVEYSKNDCLVNEAPFLTPGVGVNTSFSQANFNTCQQGAAAATCDADAYANTACRSVFTGALGQGAPCYGSFQCQPSLACSNVNQTSGCGTCQPRVATGQTCGATQGACQQDAICLAATQGATSGTCTLRTALLRTQGQACNNTGGPYCAGFGNCSVDTGAGVCQLLTVLNQGQACDLANNFQACPGNQQCKTTTAAVSTGNCTDRPASGAACNIALNEILCAAGSFCSAWENTPSNAQDPFGTRGNGTCVARRMAGGACNDPDLTVTLGTSTYDLNNLVCTGDLYCAQAGTCAAPSAAGPVPTCP